MENNNYKEYENDTDNIIAEFATNFLIGNVELSKEALELIKNNEYELVSCGLDHDPQKNLHGYVIILKNKTTGELRKISAPIKNQNNNGTIFDENPEIDNNPEIDENTDFNDDEYFNFYKMKIKK